MASNDSEEPIVGIDRKIPFIEKLFFPATGGIIALFNAVIQFYLIFFYTNTLQLNFVYTGAMIVVIRIITAALIPVFGAFIDRHTTRWGKYKPWIFITLLGTAVGAYLTFIPVNFGTAGTLVYATMTYTIFSIFLSAIQAVVMGMTTAITKRYDDRIAIAFSSSIWATLGSVSVSYVVSPLANVFGNGNLGNGFQYTMLLGMVVVVVLTLLIIRVVKERFVIPAQKQAKYSFKLMAQTLFKNKYALIAVSCSFILPLYSIKSSFSIYYCKYIFNDTSMMATLVTIGVVPMLIGMLLSPLVTKKLGLKNNLLTVAVVNIITSAAVFFVPATSLGAVAVYVLTGIGSLFMGVAQPAQGMMIPFAADYGEWKFRTNCGGFLGSINSLAKTLAIAFMSGGILTGFILSLVGYVQNSTPSAASLIGIRCAMSFIPAILFILLAFIVARWDLTKERYGEIVNEIHTRSL